MNARPLTVAWISYFPVEWLPDVPAHLASLPKAHPATWQRVLLAELEKRPSEVRLHIVVLRKHFARSETFERNGVTFHLVKTPGGMRAPSLFWVDTFLIRRVLARIQPDVVHAWGMELGAGMVAARLKYPSVTTMHGLLTWLAQLLPVHRYDRFTAWLEDRSLRRSSLVTAESAFAVRYLKERHPHLDLHQVEHAPLPLFHQVVRTPAVAPEPARLLLVGAFSYGKGADVLIHALQRLEKDHAFELIVVGSVEGPLRDRLQAESTPELWSRVKFRGSLPAGEIAAELARATLLVFASRCDNSPNVVKEAVVAGVPVVGSDIGGLPDYVIPGGNGFLFKPGDVDSATDALRAALRHPLFGRGTVDPAVLAREREYLSATHMADRFCELYRLAARRAAGSRS